MYEIQTVKGAKILRRRQGVCCVSFHKSTHTHNTELNIHTGLLDKTQRACSIKIYIIQTGFPVWWSIWWAFVCMWVVCAKCGQPKTFVGKSCLAVMHCLCMCVYVQEWSCRKLGIRSPLLVCILLSETSYALSAWRWMLNKVNPKGELEFIRELIFV